MDGPRGSSDGQSEGCPLMDSPEGPLMDGPGAPLMDGPGGAL